ncbi:hypothetical protein F511_15701 [Dorcoceras hygrometricum]|uniref:Uncharacterized protein n=1 Tax=Dorcoceras hygrometricum TaxID=472368 RepID=A0A2Z7BD85_9LAMI|nr:hypothetical protein F511_15701 [Dorcoceras hygrometricum]
MDFGLLGLDNLGCLDTVASENGAEIKKSKFCGSAFFKRDRLSMKKISGSLNFPKQLLVVRKCSKFLCRYLAIVRLLAKEIKELSLSNPVTIFNGNSSSNGMQLFL